MSKAKFFKFSYPEFWKFVLFEKFSHFSDFLFMNKFFETDENFLEWVSKYTDKPLIAEGNIKSPQVLKEIFNLGKAELYGLDRTLFSRPQWYHFLKKKMFTP